MPVLSENWRLRVAEIRGTLPMASDDQPRAADGESVFDQGGGRIVLERSGQPNGTRLRRDLLSLIRHA